MCLGIVSMKSAVFASLSTLYIVNVLRQHVSRPNSRQCAEYQAEGQCASPSSVALAVYKQCASTSVPVCQCASTSVECGGCVLSCVQCGSSSGVVVCTVWQQWCSRRDSLPSWKLAASRQLQQQQLPTTRPVYHCPRNTQLSATLSDTTIHNMSAHNNDIIC